MDYNSQGTLPKVILQLISLNLMHKYIKKQAKLQQQSQNSSIADIKPTLPFKRIRIACQRGQKFQYEQLGELVSDASSKEQKQDIVYELLMYRKVKVVEKLIKQKKIDKAHIIDSNHEIKALYDSLIVDIQVKKNRQKGGEQEEKGQDVLATGQMSTKEKAVQSIKRITKFFKNIHPKYYALIFGLILMVLLVKKHRKKIIAVLRMVLNI